MRQLSSKTYQHKDGVSVIYGQIDPYSPWKIAVNSLSSPEHLGSQGGLIAFPCSGVFFVVVVIVVHLSSSMQPLGHSESNFTWSIQRKGGGGAKVFIIVWSRPQDQNGCHTHKWYKPFNVFLSRTGNPITLKLGTQHQGFKDSINCEPGLVSK